MKNLENRVIKDFGNEWKYFDHQKRNNKIQQINFNQYFLNFPFKLLKKNFIGFDAGCGTGRWAKFILQKNLKLNCIEPSEAINVAKKNLKNFKKVKFIKKTILNCNLKKNSHHFGYCLGVLHHTNDVKKNLLKCNQLLKKDAPFLLYLYYNFENKTKIFKSIWWISNLARIFISNTPFFFKKIICYFIAILIYLPLAKLSLFLSKYSLFKKIDLPLTYYKNKDFYIMYNDALDRFGTKIEKRFSKKEIRELLNETGFKNLRFNKSMPYWTVLSYKK